MGCDIHSYTERKGDDNKWFDMDYEPFSDRSYRLFGFLADVRNYSAVTPISEPRGLPDDLSESIKNRFDDWYHSASWLTLDELLKFDYDALTEDRRCAEQLASNLWHGGCTAEPGAGEVMTYREFLGEYYFDTLEEMKVLGVERIVFWFDC